MATDPAWFWAEAVQLSVSAGSDGERMSRLSISLFGKFSIRSNDQAVDGLSGSKVQELLCYLLLHRERPHPRETLASLLWGESRTAQSKKYLRQALWQLQLALKCHSGRAEGRTLVVDPDWVQLDSRPGLSLDVAVFERASAAAHGVPGHALDDAQVQALRQAVDLYAGDLLEGWYQDWCLYERERLQNMYLAMLDKLMGWCEARHEYEAALAYGARTLQYDRAREATHQRLMRLQFLAGDRAGALRQYERCVSALAEELGVEPAERTVALYQQIRVGQLEAAPAAGQYAGDASGLPEAFGRLQQLRGLLVDLQRQVQHDLQAVEAVLKRGHSVRS
jgi:DNA-binding SARP family transcriptional activator